MAEHVYTVLCQKSITDQRSNNISMLDILDKIEIQTPEDIDIPNRLAFRTELVIQFTRSNPNKKEKNITCKVSLIGPSGKAMQDDAILNFDLAEKQNGRISLVLESFPLEPKSGIYTFETRFKSKKNDRWKLASKTPLEVQLLKID